jgi:hypothetical protein
LRNHPELAERYAKLMDVLHKAGFTVLFVVSMLGWSGTSKGLP